MVGAIFKVVRSDESPNGWGIQLTETDEIMNLPEKCYEDLAGKYLSSEDILEKVETVSIALAGITDSYNMVDPYSYDRRSVIKTIKLIGGTGTIDDLLTEPIEVDEYKKIYDYEKYHTVIMGRDVAGDDTSIHAYIETPNAGKLRCVFSRGVRVDAKRNNIKYWIDDYQIDEGTNGGKYVRPLTDPIEIM